MKKTLAIIAALFMVVGIASTAMAAYQVEVKTNSEGVTGAPNACEKAGNITFIIDAGTVIRSGDWWTADLPLGVTLCSSFDFMVVGTPNTAFPLNALSGFSGTLTAPGDGLTLDRTIWAINDLAGIAGTNGSVTVSNTAGGSGIGFRVRGAAGSNRLRIDVYDNENAGAGGVGDASNYDGDTTFTVGADASFQIKLFDGFDGLVGGTNAYALNDTTPSPLDGIYGNAVPQSSDYLQASNDTDNTYCITVDTDTYSGSTVNVSINSGGQSGNNFLTFNPSNPQVAHLISATTITLDSCKGDEWGYVEIAGGQNATCSFEYNTPTNYCPDFDGNSFILTNQSGTFFDAGDEYRVRLQISGNGAYFAAAPAFIDGTLPAEDPCEGDGTDVSAGWATPVTETGAAFTTYRGAACGAFDAGEEVVSFTSNAFSGIDTYNRLHVDIPTVVYDADAVAAGEEVTVTVELWRLPCGLIFTAERKVAEFVDLCEAAVPTSTLYYPFTVALDGSQGYWFGMAIGNPSANAGTADVMFYEADGDMGTFTTDSIPAGGILVMGGADLLSALTADAGNAGTLGDDYGHIVVITNFGSAGGFGMTGNGADSTGYTAYGKTGAGVGTWTY